jgi:hypothetical protein
MDPYLSKRQHRFAGSTWNMPGKWGDKDEKESREVDE